MRWRVLRDIRRWLCVMYWHRWVHRDRWVYRHRHWHGHGQRRVQHRRRRVVLQRQRAVGRRRARLCGVRRTRRPRSPHTPPPRWLFRLALRACYATLPLCLHSTVHIATRHHRWCILHLHYVHVHIWHILSARLARDAHRDRVRLAQRGRRRHGQPHLVGCKSAVRRARMTTAVWRLGRVGRASRRFPPAEAAIGAGARKRRRAALVRLPQQRGERLSGGERRRGRGRWWRRMQAAHLATARRCRTGAGASAFTHPTSRPPAQEYHILC